MDKIKSITTLKSIYCYSSVLEGKSNLNESYLRLSKIQGNSLNSISEINKIKTIAQPPKETYEIKATKIFISYSHEDKNWLELIKKHLKVLHFEGDKLNVWDDTKIKAGNKWKDEIEKSLNDCKIAILLISTDFLASDFINNNELPPLLKSAASIGTKILPLIIEPCRFLKNKDLNIFQSVNNPTQPLSTLSRPEQDNILLKIVEDIEFYLNES